MVLQKFQINWLSNQIGNLCKRGVAAFGRKPHSPISKVLRRSAETPLRLMDGFAEISNQLVIQSDRKPLQKGRSGFRQKAALSNFQGFAALCRDAVTVDGWFCRNFKSIGYPIRSETSAKGA